MIAISRTMAMPLRTSLLLVLSGLTVPGACVRGNFAGSGVACDDRNRCRSFLACIDGRCRPTDQPRETPADGRVPDEPHGELVPPGDVRDGPNDGDDPRPDGPPQAAPPVLIDPASAPQVFAFVAAQNGTVWYSRGIYDNARAPWPDFVELTGQLGNIGPITDLEGLQLGADILLVARAGQAWHHTTRTEGRWARWSLGWAGLRSVGLARTPKGGEACTVDPGGRFGMAARRADGSWDTVTSPPGLSVSGAPAVPLPTFVATDCTWAGGELHVLLVDERGRLWHTAARQGGWRPLAVLPLPDQQLRDVEAAGLPGELHVMAVTAERQFHSIRLNDGSWQEFGDYGASQMSPLGALHGTSITGVLDTLHVGWLAESGGLFHSLRWNYIYIQPFRLLTPGGTAHAAVTLVGYVY